MKDIMTFLAEMSASSSSNDKKAVLKKWSKNPSIVGVLRYTYDNYKQYGLTSKQLKKMSHLHSQECYDNIFSVLDALANKDYTGHDAIAMVNGYIATFCKTDEERDVVYKILDRNLEIRAGVRLINKVIPGCIPVFNVALAEKFQEKYVDFNDTWFGSRKLDGVRCIARKEDGQIKFFSRQGKEFHTLGKLAKALTMFMREGTVYDGEVCIMRDGLEDFQGIMKEIRRKNHTIDFPVFWIFDQLTLEEFDSGTSTRTFAQRYKSFRGLNLKNIKALNQYNIDTTEKLNDFANECEKAGYEGMMMRKDDVYKGERSRDILKVKKMHDAEYEVTGIITDDHRVVRDGKEVVIPMLSAATIEHKGNLVKVGSGWSQDERITYYNDPQSLIGKTITVQYFEESQNKAGEWSLRFPVKKFVYEDGRKV